MNKLEAEAIASKYRTAIGVHYQHEAEKLRAEQERAEESVRTWVESRAYRKKGYEAPYVQAHTLQVNHSVDILRALLDPSMALTIARLAVRRLLNGPPR